MSLLPNLGSIGSGVSNFYSGAATQSVRFPVGETHLQRTPGTSGNQKKWTSSFWVKRTKLGTGYLWSGASYSGNDGIAAIYFDSDQLHTYYDGSSAPYGAIGPDLYRDVNAWYHIVWAVDAANTVHRIWVNGVLRSTDTGKYPENFAWGMNRANTLNKFGEAAWGNSAQFEGYLADFYHLDGQYLDYTSFAEFKNGVLIPKVTSGLTFGTNGFHLEFKQNSVGSGAADTIGADTSGEDNHLDSAIIAADDCNMPDSPENNFAVLNPTAQYQQGTLSEGSLKFVGDGGNNWDEISSTFAVSSGKWYWEVQFLTIQQLNSNIAGIRQTATQKKSDGKWYGTSTAVSDIGVVFGVMDVNGLVTNSSGSGTLSMAIAAEDIVQFRLDLDDNELGVSVDGTDKGKAWDITANIEYTPSSTVYNSSSVIYNFGQDSTFAGTETATSNADENGFGTFHSAVPSGYLALCTANLPEPTIGPNSDTQATDHFNTVLYTANNSQAKTVTGLGLRPDWLWIKGRNFDDHHAIFDSNRGVTKFISAARNSAQFTDATLVTAFNSDGFVLGTDDFGWVNYQSTTLVAWGWKANASTATATISESGNNPAAVVQANPTAGFSIITYTGTGANGTIAHGLGAVPQMMIFKNLATTQDWAIYHGANTAAPATDHLHLNNTLNTADDETYFNDTKPTSSVLTIGSHVGINTNDETYVAYVFAEIEGYSKFGGYVGNENSDGAFVYTGFRPAFLICKITDGGTTAYYAFFDNKRESANVKDAVIFNSNAAENTAVNDRSCDFLSNGFKLRSSAFRINGSGDNHVYFAWAETPFKYANAV